MVHSASRYRIWFARIVLALLAGVATASFLPLIETNVWWIRFLDFPRVQFAALMLVLLVLYLGLRRRPSRLEWIAVLGVLAALGYHAYKLHPYSGLVEPTAEMQADCPEGHTLRIMIANVKRSNERVEAFLDQVAASDPDLLLVMETDAWWDQRLSDLHDRFPHRVQNIPENPFYGMHLFSKMELISPEFRFFFGADTPTAVTQVRLPGGESIGFIGLHPRPPDAWSQPTTMRDAHLLQAALMARESNVPTILAGDFNAVPWERITRRAMRIGALLDPRVGRGLLPTYNTRSVLISWPLDQILFQPAFTLQGLRAVPVSGSDHRAAVAALCLDPGGAQAVSDLLPDDLAEAQTAIDAARRDQLPKTRE